MHWGTMSTSGVCFYVREGAEFLTPDYVLEHAAELDGAKKPWEIPPEGYRLVTEEEIRKYKQPKDNRVMYYSRLLCEWSPIVGFGSWSIDDSYAVPIGFDFEPAVEEMTVAEVERRLGCKVKIVKEDAQ